MGTVLTVSYDSNLQETRDAILREAGYETISANSKAEAVTAIRTANYDLLVLCHSVPDPEQAEILCEARKENEIPVLCLRVGAVGGQPEHTNTTVMQYSPARFVRTVGAILNRPKIVHGMPGLGA